MSLSPSHYFSPNIPEGSEAEGSKTEASKQAARHFEATVNGLTLQFATGDGVFSKSALDEGSHLLLETALKHNSLTEDSWPEKAKIADLGCGWGAISCFLAALAPQTTIFGCDINERAVAFAHQNARLNNLKNAFFWCGDGFSATENDFTENDFFDVIFFNPPVRAGNETIQRLFEDAKRCLKPRGELWVVLRTAQGAKSWHKRLKAQFGSCETVEIKHGYRILQCKAQD